MFKFVITVFLILIATVSFGVEDKKVKVDNHPDGYYFRQFQDVFQRIEKDYMQVPNRQEMTDEAINGMLRSLDPYSGYFTDDDLEFFITQTDSESRKIGIPKIVNIIVFTKNGNKWMSIEFRFIIFKS